MDDFESATNKASAEKAGKASCLLTRQELFNKKVQAGCALCSNSQTSETIEQGGCGSKNEIIELVTSFTSSCV